MNKEYITMTAIIIGFVFRSFKSLRQLTFARESMASAFPNMRYTNFILTQRLGALCLNTP